MAAQKTAGITAILKNGRVMDYLVAAYPDHGFVIDREEAGDLFHNVEKPTAELERLADALGEREATHAKSKPPVRPKRAGSQEHLGVAGGRTSKSVGRRAGNGAATCD